MTTRRDPHLRLTEATVQEIQLELVERASFNLLDGRRVVASLREHDDLWLAVLMDLPWTPERGGLIKLRDLPAGNWNVDTLFILTPDPESARRIARIAEDEEWRADEVTVDDDPAKVAASLGSTPTKCALVSMWWD